MSLFQSNSFRGDTDDTDDTDDDEGSTRHHAVIPSTGAINGNRNVVECFFNDKVQVYKYYIIILLL